MPPKRKRATAAAEEGESSSKKTKVKVEEEELTLDGVTVCWEWENDGCVWTRYSDEHNHAITEAVHGDQTDVRFKAGSTELRVIPGKMVQKNTKTSWERRVRLCVRDDATDAFLAWEWQEDGGSWTPYSHAHAVALENAHQAGGTTLQLKLGRSIYTVDLQAMTQKNESTGNSRPVRRGPSAAAGGDATKPKEVSASKTKAAIAATTAAAKGAGDAGKSDGKKGKSASGRSKVKQEAEEEEEETSVRTVTMKGAAPVDPECTAKVGTAHVFSEGKDIWDAMLNQTNLQNNNNKYYLLQLLEDDARRAFSVWFRWGRVGFGGQNTLIPCGTDLDQAKKAFCKKFSDKTKNDWANRKKFAKIPGKYDLVHIDYSAKTEDEGANGDAGARASPSVPDSQLPQQLQDLINLICDVKSMEEMVIEMKYDAKKAPLGKLTPTQIKAGYTALKRIDACITAGDFGQKLVQACDEFYTRIPHCFGMQRPPMIRTKEVLKAKIQLLEALSDIEVAMKIIKERVNDQNPIDTHYDSLKCDMTALSASDADYKMVEDYLHNTHAKTHNQYKMQVLDVFHCDKHGTDANFQNVGNRMLLWHGSRLTNWVGILSQGLRIAPPEAPVTGYMFGKGVYFADMSSKSANYCFASRTKDVGLVLLCEVALGKMNELLDADYTADKLPAGKHSVKGMGAIAPDPKKLFTTSDGVTVPIGKAVNTGVSNPSGYTLNYNEFIVYDVKQIRMKYLVKVKFNFK